MTNPITAALEAAKAVGVEARLPNIEMYGDDMGQAAHDLTVAAIRRGLVVHPRVMYATIHDMGPELCVIATIGIHGAPGYEGSGGSDIAALTAAMVAMGAQDGD